MLEGSAVECTNSDKRRETFNYCLGCLNQEISQQMTLKLTDPFILTNRNTTKTSILLFMSRLVPGCSPGKSWYPTQPGALVTHKSQLYQEIKDEQRSWHWTGSTSRIPAMILRQNGRSHHQPHLLRLDSRRDETELIGEMSWVWQRWSRAWWY